MCRKNCKRSSNIKDHGTYHNTGCCSQQLDLQAQSIVSPHKKALGCYRALFSSGFLLHKRRCSSRRWTRRPNHRPPLQKRFLLDSQFLRFSDLTTAVEVAPLVLGIISWARFSIRRAHRSGRPREINFMSRYICFSQIGPFDVCFEELFSKVQNPGGFFRKIVF